MGTEQQSGRDGHEQAYQQGGIPRRAFLKRAVALAAVPVGAALLAACGGSAATATATAVRSAAASAASAAPSASAAASVAATTGAATTVATATTGAAASAAATPSASASAAASAATPAAAATTAAATPATSGSAADATAKVVAAANAFLATLDSSQKSSVQFEWSNTTQKQRWSNLPQGLYQRAGLMWGNLSDAQHTAWLTVMQATLSTEAYNRVIAEWTADDQLGGGGSYGMKYYWVALIGVPSTTSAWQWQWGGHHVTVNATIMGANISLTPSFIGVQPASYTANGQTIRPLGDIEDEAFALVGSLDATQQKAAVLGSSVIDLVLGPGQDGKTIQSEGLPGSQMTATQQAAFLTLINHYAGLGNDTYAASRLAEIKTNLAQTYLAWYGPTTKGSAAYFRVTGPTVVIEYSPQGGGGNGNGVGGATSANHIHGIYRDPTNDYGAKFAK